ncbi:hypothetical protein niasHT_003209 [Heterodera trifolii]|uniref:CRAL-TRIO domain-containing protein n=1 Tax=Heterodera trifolii TaxID=157864 RepID=A0ABD2LQS8_9BILA
MISLSGENDEKELTNQITGQPLAVGFRKPSEWPEKAAEWGTIIWGQPRVHLAFAAPSLVPLLLHLRIESISPVVEQRCPTKNASLFHNNLLAAGGGRGGFVLVVDRRMDKWSSVRNLFTYLMCYFPETVCLVFLLKPEGVLQRAIEYAYRGLMDSNDKFKVVTCQNCDELHEYVGPNSLTMDVGGTIKHDHSEWAAHRVDIERMKSSARIIAESLSEFGKCLRETELPNDVQTTERILKLQQQERDAIKEDFRISIRKGMALLRQVRHTEQSDHLSPSRLQNVTAIERMINQLQDTERSFDTFWQKHRQRLLGCLELRQFEDEFRKLQNHFAKHMLRLEEHRQLGDSEEIADGLAREHAEYGTEALDDVIRPCRALRKRGIELSEKGGDLSELLNSTKGSDSVGPKCDELNRMAEVLGEAVERRGQMLEKSRKMHAQIAKANNWCRRGVELLYVASLDLLSAGCSNNLAIYEHATERLEQFITEGDALKLEVLSTASSCFSFPSTASSSSVDRPMLNSSTETCSLLTQVTERIDDIRRLSRARHEALKRLGEEKGRQREGARPVQVVSPEKTEKRDDEGKVDKMGEALLQKG